MLFLTVVHENSMAIVALIRCVHVLDILPVCGVCRFNGQRRVEGVCQDGTRQDGREEV